MAVPIRYNLRHIVQRWRTTCMTVGAIALVVAMFVSVQSLGAGLAFALSTSGDPLNVLILRKGSTAETNSSLDREQFNVVKFLPQVTKNAEGISLAAPESVNIMVMKKVGGGETNVVARGTTPLSLQVRSGITLVEGSMYEPSKRQIIVGNAASKRFADAQVGQRIKLVKSEYTIVGRFDAGRTAFDSEFWGDVEELNREFDRTVYSSAVIRVATELDRESLIAAIQDDARLKALDPKSELAYYQDQTKSALPIQFLGSFLSVVMSVGAVFAAMNTMYASVSNRAWEIATLRVVGFSRRSIMFAFLIESVALATIGGILGGLLALPLNGLATGTSNMVSFSEVAFAFRITPGLYITGVIFAAGMGLAGGFLPALQAARRPIIDSLRGNA